MGKRTDPGWASSQCQVLCWALKHAFDSRCSHPSPFSECRRIQNKKVVQRPKLIDGRVRFKPSLPSSIICALSQLLVWDSDPKPVLPDVTSYYTCSALTQPIPHPLALPSPDSRSLLTHSRDLRLGQRALSQDSNSASSDSTSLVLSRVTTEKAYMQGPLTSAKPQEAVCQGVGFSNSSGLRKATCFLVAQTEQRASLNQSRAPVAEAYRHVAGWGE